MTLRIVDFIPFVRDRRGAVAAVFALSFVPLVLLLGAAVDYGRAVSLGAKMQNAADQAAVASAALDASAAGTQAANIVNAAIADTGETFATQTTVDPGSNALTVSVTTSLPTTIMSYLVPSITIRRSATAQAGNAASAGTSAVSDDACIFTLGETLTISTNTMTFNGSPSVNLTGCSLRSNKSMKCNGSPTGANSFAVGDIVGCSNPHPGQAFMPDIYSSLASNITLQCGTSSGGVTWTASSAGGLPTGANVKTVSQSGYTEIHICGNLTLNGTSSTSLTGAAPESDTVVIVENGGIIIANGANVNANRMTFVLASGTGSGSNYPIVTWPSGNGSNASSMSLTASTGASNPWKGMAIYQNPSINAFADMSWGSGTTLTIDGIIYFPNAQFTVYGQVMSGPSACSKVVVGEFTLNGAVNLKQSSAACSTMQVTQYYQAGTTATAATSPYLIR
jgi:Flp pilus assembly protein TadG